MTLKVCTRCGESKEAKLFYRRALSNDGLRAECKACTNKDNKEYGQRHPEVVRKASKQWVARHPEKRRAIKLAWSRRHPESIKAMNEKQYAKRRVVRSPHPPRVKCVPDWKALYWANRAKALETQARWRDRNRAALRAKYLKFDKENRVNRREQFQRYRAKKFQAIPKWANRQAMRAIYAEAARLTKETGIKHHVDHAVPLNHPLVQGFHNEFNLQILTASANIAKGNRHWPDMPEVALYRQSVYMTPSVAMVPPTTMGA